MARSNTLWTQTAFAQVPALFSVEYTPAEDKVARVQTLFCRYLLDRAHDIAFRNPDRAIGHRLDRHAEAFGKILVGRNRGRTVNLHGAAEKRA